MGSVEKSKGREWSVIILAIALATALNLICFAAVYDAIHSQISGLSENATQIISGAFGGIIGVLGTYLGYNRGLDDSHRRDIPSQVIAEAPSEPEQEAPQITTGTLPDE